MKALITGRAGSGKTSVYEELLRRGHQAYDADHVPGLCEWQSRASGKKAAVDAHKFVDLEKYWWSLDDKPFREFVAKHDDFFICVGAAHELEYTDIFTHSFVLDVSATTHYQRLQSRTNNDYGKDPRMARTIVRLQADLVKNAVARGFIGIDADRPIAEVVNNILTQV